LVEAVRWQHRERSLPSPTASYYSKLVEIAAVYLTTCLGPLYLLSKPCWSCSYIAFVLLYVLPGPASDNVLRVLHITCKSVHFRRSYSQTREYRNNVERVFREISFFRQSPNKLNMFNLFRLPRKDEISPKKISFDVAAKNGNNVEATFNFVERTVRPVAFDNVAATLSLRQCCFDLAAGVGLDRALESSIIKSAIHLPPVGF